MRNEWLIPMLLGSTVFLFSLPSIQQSHSHVPTRAISAPAKYEKRVINEGDFKSYAGFTLVSQAPALVVEPAGKSYLTLFQQSSDIEIPMDFERNQILINVHVNGEGPFLMLLDSGTDPSVFDLTFAKHLGLPIEPIRRPGVGAGTEEIVGYKTEVREITVGTLRIQNLLTVSVDMSKAIERLDRDLKGVLGYGFLQGQIVQIDYPRRSVRFLANSTKPANSCEHFTTPMKANPQQSIPVVDGLEINGRPIRAALDTGSSLNVMVLPKAIEFLGLSSYVQQAKPSTAVGYGGQVELRDGPVLSLSLGPMEIENKEVSFAVRGMKEEALSMRGASIGNGLLKNFVVTFDYRNSTVVFEKACTPER